MSNNIRKYFDHEQRHLTLTAFVGGIVDGKSIQFTINNNCYVSLNEQQTLDLIRVLSARLMCKKGYSATDEERKNIVYKEPKQ